MSTLHTYAALWMAYPDYINYPDPEEVKKMIGGDVDDSWITNTCAVRLSRALNYNDLLVPGTFAGMHTVKGGDGKRYAFRVREIRKWLEHSLGKPDFDLKKKQGADFDKSAIASARGIIGFDIHFADATGHLDLWDGMQFSSEYHTSTDYWAAATRVSIWQAG